MITRKNYEEYFLDYFDGNLSDEKVEELLRFLSFNKDLEEEFYLLMEQTADFSLEKSDFSNITLKREASIGYELSTFDYLCVAELEHDITASEKQLLTASIDSNDKLKAEFNLFQQTKLEDELIVCPFKDELKKNVFVARSNFQRNLITYSSIAAAVLVVFYFTLNEEKVVERLAQSDDPKVELVAPQTTNEVVKELVLKPLVADNGVSENRAKLKDDVSNYKANEDSSLNTFLDKHQETQTEGNLRSTEPEMAHISSKSVDKLDLENRSLAISLYESSKTSVSKGVESNKAVDENMKSSVETLLSKAAEEKEILSRELSEATGRKKGLFIARAINGINSVLGTNIEYSSKYDADGNLVAMNIEAGPLKYSKKNEGTK